MSDLSNEIETPAAIQKDNPEQRMMPDTDDTMERRDWTLWVFAGPGALSGLCERDSELGFVETLAGEHVPISALLERALAGGALAHKVAVFLAGLRQAAVAAVATALATAAEIVRKVAELAAELARGKIVAKTSAAAARRHAAPRPRRCCSAVAGRGEGARADRRGRR